MTKKEELKSWRIGKRFTQKQAADFFYVTLVTYSRWERGISKIPRYVEAFILFG